MDKKKRLDLEEELGDMLRETIFQDFMLKKMPDMTEDGTIDAACVMGALAGVVGDVYTLGRYASGGVSFADFMEDFTKMTRSRLQTTQEMLGNGGAGEGS